MKQPIHRDRLVWMRPLTLILLLTCTALSGWSQHYASARTSSQPEYGERSRQTTLAASQTKSLTTVLSELERRYQVIFDFDHELVSHKMVLSDIAERPNVSLERILTDLLTPHNLAFEKYSNRSYLIMSRTIRSKPVAVNPSEKVVQPVGPILSLLPSMAAGFANALTNRVVIAEPSADRTITGTVNDPTNGVGLPGVNVVVKGTGTGTTTDSEGRFRLNVAEGRNTLVISYIGYITQEIDITNRNTVTVSLAIDDRSLNEVVVVGYGEQKKSDLTGAVASIQSKDIVRANPILASKALQGQVAGVTVTKSDNRPGSGYNITIRGENTINNSTAPLVVIDGLIGGDINNLNPNDIQSMDVLKDASSTAIYGARGANGVIIITTKKGVSGKPRVSYDSYVGVKIPAHIPKLMNTAQYYKSVYTDKILEGGTPATFTANELDNVKNNHTTDWVGLITRPGLQTSQNLSISGGTEKTTYRFSGGFLNEDGNVISTGYKRYNLNAGLDSRLGDHFRVGFTSYVTYSDQNFGSQESLRGAYRARPTGTAYYKDLTNPSENSDFDLNGMAYWMGINAKQVPNPLADTDPQQSKLQTTTANIIGNAYVEYSPIKGLSIRSSISANYGSSRLGDYRGQWSKSQIGTKPRTQFTNNTIGSYTLDNILTYNLELGNHKLNFTGLQSAFYQRNEQYIIAAKDLPYNSDWYALNTGTVTSYSSSLIERSLASYMGRINYTYKDKYLATITARSDGASQLAPGNKWAFFPSVALGWKLIDEPFVQSMNAFSNLKLRVSYGQVGNAGVAPYSTQAGLLNTGYDFDGAAAYGFAPANLANKDLRWERSKELNFGLDFGVFNNRISGTIELYDRKTEDLILNQKIPTSSGFSQVTSNIGKIQNKGIEILLNTVNITNSNFSWNSSITFTKNNNKLLELYGDGQTVDKGNKLFVGLPIKGNFDYKFDGIWQTADKDLAAKYGQVPGSVRVVDVNNDGKISSAEGIDDRVYLGTQLPTFLIGITNRFKYRNFDFSFFTYYRNGTQYRNNTLAGTFGDVGQGYNALASLDYWRSDNPSNSYFGVVAPQPYKGAIFYQDASFLRISDITFGYTLSRSMMDKLKLNTARVYAQVINPIVKSKFTGFDPEFNSSVYQDDLPSMTLSLGVNLSF